MGGAFNSFNDTIMYGDITLTDGISFVKDLIGSKPPYGIDRRVDGEIVIFSSHFLEAYEKALSLNCIADMTDEEKDLYFGYINYTKYKTESNISLPKDMLQVYKALDKWTIDELMEVEHPEYAVCD
jgi:hypothetical protein